MSMILTMVDDKVEGKMLDFGDKFNDVTSIVNTTYDGFKKLAKFGVGALLNSFNKFADSKSFQTLFKGAPAGVVGLQNNSKKQWVTS